MADGGFYGPALAEAHRVEKKIADYPRVVVSPTVREFLADGRRYSSNRDMDRVMAQTACRCRGFISQDVDDLWAVDFLGQAHRELARDCSYVGSIPMAYCFVRSSAADFRQRKAEEAGKARDTEKLADRYYLLQKYIESRLGIWGIAPEQAG